MTLHDRLRAAFADCDPLQYGASRYPVWAPGLPQSLCGHATHLDCSSLTAYMLLHAYRNRLDDPHQLYRELQIFEGQPDWSPIGGVVREHIGRRVPVPVPGRWCLLQRWRFGSGGKRLSGHAMLVRQETDGLWVWHSTPRLVRGKTGPVLERFKSYTDLLGGRDGRLAVLEE